MQMNGLMPQQGGPQEDPGMAPQLGGVQQAPPEEQAQYEKFVAKGMNLIFDEKILPDLVELLKGGGDPLEGLASASAFVVGRVATAAEKAGEQLSPDVVLHGGKAIFENLADISKEANIKNYEEDPDALEGAFFRAMDQFRMMMTEAGRIDQEAAQRDLAQLETMSESGELESMMRSLAGGGEKPADDKPKRGGLMPGGM